MTVRDVNQPKVSVADPPATGPLSAKVKDRRHSHVVKAGFGVALEYYDYTVYASFLPFFAAQFFVNSGSALIATLNALAVFAVGFLLRPVGSFVGGRFADRVGRKPIMMIAITLAALAALLIACSPTFAVIGYAAPIILVASRLVQGFAHGMEQVSAFVFMAETADPKRRAWQSSFNAVALILGVLPASLLGILLTTVLTTEQMTEWGWRIPFFIGAAFGLFALYLRRSIEEPPAYTLPREAGAVVAGYWRTVWVHRRTVLRLLFMWSGMAVGFYTFAVGANSYAISALGANPNQAFWASFIAQLFYVAAIPLWARFSDRFGRRPSYLIAFGLSFVLALPLQLLLGPSFAQMLLAMAIGLVCFSAASASEVAFDSELVPNGVRATVLSVPAALAAVLFGGTASYIKTWLTSIDLVWVFTLYVMVLFAVTFFTVLFGPETKGRDFTKEAESAGATR